MANEDSDVQFVMLVDSLSCGQTRTSCASVVGAGNVEDLAVRAAEQASRLLT